MTFTRLRYKIGKVTKIIPKYQFTVGSAFPNDVKTEIKKIFEINNTHHCLRYINFVHLMRVSINYIYSSSESISKS